MPSSTFGIPPSLLDKTSSRDRTWSAESQGPVDHLAVSPQPTTSISFAATSVTSNTLSPYSHIHSGSASPSPNNASTPADSWSILSEYHSSDYSDQADPFFGVDFNDDASTPAFLEDPPVSLEDSSDRSEPSYAQTVSSAPEQNVPDLFAHPLSPGLTVPSPHTKSLKRGHKSLSALGQNSPEPLSQPPSDPLGFAPLSSLSGRRACQLTSDINTAVSSEEGTASTTAPMPGPSPRVTVSMWGRDQAHADYSLPEDDSPSTVRAGVVSTEDNLVSTPYQWSTTGRDERGIWAAGPSTGPLGWGPENRSGDEGATMNELDKRRKIAERNKEVDRWITASAEGGLSSEAPPPTLDHSTAQDDGISSREISLGSQTENKPLPGQTYYTEGSGLLTEDDLQLMRQHRLWSDAPTLYGITNQDAERQQPETSEAAMARFEQMCQETGSILSRAATWGTRRRSLPSIADMDNITSGSFLKKLSISRERKPSVLFRELRGIVRKPSHQLSKRHRTFPEDESSADGESRYRRESHDTLVPTSRTSSWTKKQPPSINTALVSMATGAAAIGTSHARSASISNMTTPRSSFMQVRNTLGKRPRSKSELPKSGMASEESHPNLVGLWKKSGGPPVAHIARGIPAPDPDDDDDDDDDTYEDSDMRAGINSIIDEITPNFAGFKQQVLKMNPRLGEQNTFLVDRIAHQQVVRYKALLKNKVKHLQQTASHSCSSGHMCIASGGSAVPFDVKGEPRGMDPLSTTYEEGDLTPPEGAISAESFPPDIPMPPTNTLPAEFECQLCYTTKKITKPSDWTKHVHEDVQPFTCTWDRCREPKIFKRKADWVRHENEGHRHLEWWTCDVEDCRHTCYRRDNFLQHLVREHKFPEPKVKTKAAVKRAGAQDPTWQKVEKCHAETLSRPQDEPCRFCGKTLPTWKKLTVHLAKHMETMSLTVLRLVAQKELDADTIISPIQDPPPRTFPPTRSEQQSFSSPNPAHSPALAQQPGSLGYPNAQHPSYTYNPPMGFSPFYNTPMSELQQPGGIGLGLHQQSMTPDFQTQAGYQNLPATTAGSYMPNSQYMTVAQQLEPFPAYINALGLHDASGTQIFDTTSLNPSNMGADQQQFRHPGSVSPYTRSPHQGQSGFFHQRR